MVTEIYIDNKLVDLYNNEDIVLSFSVNNIFELESKTGTYSNTFNIPATNNNNLIFDNLNNILSTSDKPFKRLPCLIYADGLLVVQGYADIVSASKTEYTVQIYAGNTTWFSAIENIKLSDLLLGCEYTHFWDEATVIGNRSNNWLDVFIYPNIDYGELFFLPGNAPYNVDWFKLYPAVFVKYLFKKAFDLAGLTIVSDWFNDDPLLEKQIIPFSSAFSRSENTKLRDKLISTASVDFNPPSALFSPDGDRFYILDTNDTDCYPYVNSVVWLDPFGIPFFNINPGKCWLFMDAVNVTFKYNITVDRQFNTPAFDYSQISYYDLDGNQQYYSIYNLISQPIGIYNFTGEITLPIGRGAVAFNTETNAIWKAGSKIEITKFELSGDTGALVVDPVFNWLELAGTLPDISVTDFILTIANQYGLIFQQNDFSNEVQIYQFNKIISNVGSALDYSNKLDLSEDPVITFIDDTYLRNNIFEYAPDDTDEYLSRLNGYGNGSIEVPNAPSGTEQIIFTSAFSAVIRLLSFNGGGTPLELAYIPSNEGSVFTIVNGRMAYIEQDTTSLITIDPGGYYTPVQPNVYFKELEFNNLISVYYKNISDLLNSSKSVKVLLRLNNLDINKLDFSKPIYIEYFGAYFYINEIQQYKVTSVDSTEVELILISN